MNARLVVLAAGGTGGHLFPAEALAETLTARGRRVVLVTDREARRAGSGFGAIETHALGLRRMGSSRWSRLVGLAGLVAALPRARRILAGLAPDVVVGFGGYPSIPTVLAATHAGMPTLIHEQNAVLGRANRLMARRVGRIATSFPSVAGLPDQVQPVLVGNPVRPAIGALRDQPYLTAADDAPFRLLVTGGSQGARVFADILPAATQLLDPMLRRRLSIQQQARPEDIDRARSAYAASGIAVELAPFFPDIAERLAGAHAVICRAGASTCAEIACIGRPALFIPYPFATDDHQTANAGALAAAGAGWMLAQDRCGATALAALLARWMTDPQTLVAAAAAAHALGRPDAAARLADAVDTCIPTRPAAAETKP
jgi:UDP-N-acetylglucosamine--N-acetylmuramyl-(pentapeptide) pyrophosphoryl-undecaprenol N-acetylglucosamine transferase